MVLARNIERDIGPEWILRSSIYSLEQNHLSDQSYICVYLVLLKEM